MLLGIQPEVKKSKEDLRIDFWDKRGRDARIWIMGNTASNMFFQLGAMINPGSPLILRVNQIYTVTSITQVLLVAASVKYKEKSGTLLFMAYMILISRNIIRILDFEETKNNTMSEENFRYMVLSQVIGSYASLFVYFNIFQGSKVQAFIAFLCSLLIYYCMIVENYGYDIFDKAISFVSKWIFSFVLGLYVFII